MSVYVRSFAHLFIHKIANIRTTLYSIEAHSEYKILAIKRPQKLQNPGTLSRVKGKVVPPHRIELWTRGFSEEITTFSGLLQWP